MTRGRLVAVVTLVACLHLAGCATGLRTIRRLDGGPLTPEQIDAVVAPLMRAGQVPGLGLAILRRGRPAYVKAYGLGDVEHGTPLTTETVMYGASLTKAAFAYMVMTLVDEGLVDLDRPIAASLDRPSPNTTSTGTWPATIGGGSSRRASCSPTPVACRTGASSTTTGGWTSSSIPARATRIRARASTSCSSSSRGARASSSAT